MNNIQLLASDGLNVTFAPVGTFLTGQTEYMTDHLHPNDKGQILIFKAFIIGIQSYLSKK
jgi:lysophospholipase L1-like esterase